MKKVTKILLALLIVSLFLVGCSNNSEGPDTDVSGEGSENGQKVGVILGVGGLGDQSYNDLVYAGIERAKEELGVDFDYAEPKQISEFELIMRDMASSGKYAVIISVAFDQVDALAKVAPEFPEQQFAIIDGTVEEPNVASYASKEEEGSFLVGVLAGLMTKEGNSYGLSNDLGFVGALEIPLIVKFNAGYQAGIKYVNPDANVVSDYVSGDQAFSDTTTAKEIGLSQQSKGVSIVFHAAGGSGLGVFQAAEEGDFYAIGCNSNQNHINPDHIVASMLKRVDTAAYQIVQAACIDDNLAVGEETVLGIVQEGVGYTVEGSNVELSDEDLAIIEEARQAIADGELVVPTTLEEVDEFVQNNQYNN